MIVVTIDHVAGAVCRAAGITKADLVKRDRSLGIRAARSAVAYLAKTCCLNEPSFAEMGTVICGRPCRNTGILYFKNGEAAMERTTALSGPDMAIRYLVNAAHRAIQVSIAWPAGKTQKEIA